MTIIFNLNKMFVLITSTMCLFCMSSAFGMVILKDDGSSMNCVVNGEQSITVKTSSWQSTVKVTDILWMAGGDTKRIRTKGQNPELLRGTVEKKELSVRRGQESLAIPTEKIIFLYCENIDLERVGALEIVEADNVTTLLQFARSSNGKGLKVTLLPANWGGNIQISSPDYLEKISGSSDLKVDFSIRGDEGLYHNLSEKVNDLIVTLRIDFQGGFRTCPRSFGKARGSLPTSSENANRISFFFDRALKNLHGSGSAYLFLTHKGNDRECLGRESLVIHKTVSNVLRLPFEVERKEPKGQALDKKQTAVPKRI